MVARRPRLSVVGRLEEAIALDDCPETLGLVRVRDDRRDAEMAGRLLTRIVPVLARVVLGRRQELPRLAAVAALEDARHLRPPQQPAMRRSEARDFRHLEAAVLAKA